MAIAADVNAGFGTEPVGLPDTGKEFIGAALGVNAKNWLNMLDRVGQLSDLSNLQNELDGLAKRFIGEWIGKAFDAISATEFAAILEKVHKVVDSYQKLDDSAITLFDRYFSRLDFLTAKLNELAALTSWDRLKGDIDPTLWAIVSQLTDGDPLGWILGQVQLGDEASIPTLADFKKRVQQVLDLIQSDAHKEIRDIIRLAKEQFPLDGFINQLADVDTIPELMALANTKAGEFVERLIGKAFAQISSNEALNQALKAVQKSVAAIDSFEGKLFDKFKEELTQSYKFSLHAEYSKTDDRTALIDVKIRIRDDQGNPLNQGLALMRAAGRGDFQEVLANYRPDLVQIIGGTLSHIVRKQSSFNVDISGWHSHWNYQGFDRVLVDTEQRFVVDGNGGIAVQSTLDLTNEKERKSNGALRHTNFLLRFVGESSGTLEFDRANQQYLIDSIDGMASTYGLTLSDPKTNTKDLKYYLSFAHDFGLDVAGANFAQLQLVLPTLAGDPNDFGEVECDYEVRFTETGLRRFTQAPFDEAALRLIMRKTVLTHYIRELSFANVGWAYWTSAVYSLWKADPEGLTNHSTLAFANIQASPFAQVPEPKNFSLGRIPELQTLKTLYRAEDKLANGFKELFKILNAHTQIQPKEFEHRLSDIGAALSLFDGLVEDLNDEGVNSVFAVFDQLIRQQTPASEARASSLRLVSKVTAEPKEIEIIS